MRKRAWYAVAVITIIIISAVAAYWVTQKKEEPIKIIGEGDFVTVDYIGWINDTGLVFDTSIEEVALDNVTYQKDQTFEFRSVYQPLNFTVGAGQMIKGFDEAVLDMRKGETKTVILEPWEAYGNWSWENVRNISVVESVQKTEVIKKSYFEAMCDEPIGKGVVLTHWVWKWNTTIVDVEPEGDNITLEHLVGTPGPNLSYWGLTVQSTKYDWNSTVINITQAEILVRHNAERNMSTTVVGKGKVMNITNQSLPLEHQEIVVDLNHKLASKTLKFEITIVNIKKAE